MRRRQEQDAGLLLLSSHIQREWTALAVKLIQLLAETIWHLGWGGMGWDGMGWDGMGWDGMGWDGMGWDANYRRHKKTHLNQ
jgi:hypothetical protein